MLPAVRSEKSSQSGLVGPEEACKEWNRWLKQLCKKVLWTISLLVICCITIIWTVCNFAGVTPDQIETYFGRLACDISGSLYLYNFPDRTGYTIPADVVQRLALNHSNIVGCKDTIAGMDHTLKIILGRENIPERK